MKINLGSGRDYRDGYLNVDDKSQTLWKVDVVADVFEYDTTEKFKEVLVCHFAMYIPQPKMLPLLKRWYGWLTQGGKIIIETGDIKKIANKISENNDPVIINETIKQLFGWEETVGHKWVWCAETLKPLLEEAGFKNIETMAGKMHKRPDRDFIIIGQKI